ncbi:MAG TPA: 50S ribosomal protein L22 [bacterium]|nr:50S ribosomal protein L22 [bacterium]
MEAYAIAKSIRMSAYKVRRVLSLIRKLSVFEAREILKYMPGAAAPRVLKVLNSAIANFKNKNSGIDENSLIVTSAVADEGPTMKRIISRSQGRAERINKRTCTIKISVGSY